MLDEKIVDLYWARSEEAISETSKKYGKLCFSISYNILKSREDAEECVNDTYLAAWNSMPTHRPERLMAFLGKITRNLSLNRYESHNAKKRGGGEVKLALDELEECVSGGECPDEVLDRLVMGDVINSFLRRQRPLNRDVFISRYWFFHSPREIAGFYDITEGNVNNILYRMRRELRALLKKEGVLA